MVKLERLTWDADGGLKGLLGLGRQVVQVGGGASQFGRFYNLAPVAHSVLEHP